MAIAEMKRITLVGMNADKGRILRKLQRLGCVEIVRTAEESGETERARLEEIKDRLTRLEWAIKKLAPYDPVKKGMFAQRSVADSDSLAAVQAGEGEIMARVARLEALERSLGEIRSRELRLEAMMQRLAPWLMLGVPLSTLRRGGPVRFWLLMGSAQHMSSWQEQARAGLDPMPEIREMDAQSGQVYCVAALHESTLAEAEELIRKLGLERVQLDEFEGDPREETQTMKAQMAACEEERAEIWREMADMARDLESMRVLRDSVSVLHDRQAATERIASTRSAFVMEGWTPAAMAQQVEETIRKSARDVCLEIRDPLDTEKPPTLLVNGKLAQPFESVIEMFSLPDPRGFDPTAVMWPFFAMLFGVMVSDAGYGIVMMLMTALYIWLAKPRGGMANMARIIFWGGAGTLFWGAMFGGWFGETWHPIMFAPLDDPVSMIVLCVVFGMVHVLTGMGLAAYINIRAGRIWDAVWDQVTWFCVLLGVPMLLLPATAAIGKWMIIGGFAGIFLFGGRAKKGIFARLLGGAGKLYDVTTFLGDILSYMRLFGMGLATGVIGMVFNLLARMVMGSFVGFIAGVVIMIAGHAFNLGINALGAYVNACRLQYIEFFGHFYEQGGVPFKPLRYETRYVDIDPMYDVE